MSLRKSVSELVGPFLAVQDEMLMATEDTALRETEGRYKSSRHIFHKLRSASEVQRTVIEIPVFPD